MISTLRCLTGRLIVAEDRASGSVPWSIYGRFALRMGLPVVCVITGKSLASKPMPRLHFLFQPLRVFVIVQEHAQSGRARHLCRFSLIRPCCFLLCSWAARRAGHLPLWRLLAGPVGIQGPGGAAQGGHHVCGMCTVVVSCCCAAVLEACGAVALPSASQLPYTAVSLPAHQASSTTLKRITAPSFHSRTGCGPMPSWSAPSSSSPLPARTSSTWPHCAPPRACTQRWRSG